MPVVRLHVEEEIFIWASITGMPEQMVADHIERIATRLKPLLEPL